jgi:hypothetical protein
MREYKTNYKSKVILLVLSTLFLGIFSFNFIFAFGGVGDGSDENPYQITNCNQLQEMNTDLTSSYILMNDIDCSDTINWDSGEGFKPVGTNATSGTSLQFAGQFNGNHHKITNLYINRPLTYDVGLFGYCELCGSSIHDVGLDGAVVYGKTGVGALVGENRGCNISNSYVINSNVTCFTQSCGVFVGFNSYNTLCKGQIYDSYSSGIVTGSLLQTGGFVGYNKGLISNSYSTALVYGGSLTGGFVGSSGICTGTYWDINASNQTTSACSAIGLYTSDMKKKSSYAGWDFVYTWGIEDSVGYPFLLWENPLYLDSDRDSYPDVTDCSPLNPAVHPNAIELCNGIDDNCNVTVDEGFPDSDRDGIANCMEADADNDGILDSNDLCPTVSSRGYDANLDGCIDNITGLKNIINSASISGGLKNSLMSKLNNAESSISKGRDFNAMIYLLSFVLQVQSQPRSKRIPQSTMIINYASNVISKLW